MPHPFSEAMKMHCGKRAGEGGRGNLNYLASWNILFDYPEMPPLLILAKVKLVMLNSKSHYDIQNEKGPFKQMKLCGCQLSP